MYNLRFFKFQTRFLQGGLWNFRCQRAIAAGRQLNFQVSDKIPAGRVVEFRMSKKITQRGASLMMISIVRIDEGEDVSASQNSDLKSYKKMIWIACYYDKSVVHIEYYGK